MSNVCFVVVLVGIVRSIIDFVGCNRFVMRFIVRSIVNFVGSRFVVRFVISIVIVLFC